MTRTALAMAVALFATPALAAEPPSAGPLDPASFYAGTWYEQARTPTGLTKGCEWATTAYSRDDKGRIQVRDECRQGREDGSLRAIAGPGEVKDPGVNATLEVRYRLGPLRPTRTYRIITTDEARSWFISAEPKMERVYLFSREIAPPMAEVEAWVGRIRALGYAGELEILATPGRPKP
jgi:apolipoprotein D and lipocalin family protein